jgi:hydrogenase maturation protein HypF
LNETPQAAASSGANERRAVRVKGTVQGVGFRPFVYREARRLGLSGFVGNDSGGVFLEVEGVASSVAELCRLLVESPPPLALVTAVEVRSVALVGETGFTIVESRSLGPPAAPVSVDTATCADCLADIEDGDNRRYGYPFTNCTNCGPRYTIVISVPYDRPATTMSAFTMCALCQAEYDDPADRRFHAQPNSCPVCGPQVAYELRDGTVVAEAAQALGLAVEALCKGEILAVKGLGGYHLAADATSDAAVAELRKRKARDEKPFAVMVPDVRRAAALCELDELAQAALSSPRRPIVLAPKRRQIDPPGADELPALADRIAPGLPELGLMLPYTPLHHLLIERVGRPLVMTSGNLSDDPIAHLDADARERLGPLVDGFLTHDRRIHIRCDDSVVRSAGKRVQAVRRSRGLAPEPMMLPGTARRQVLALGAELKNTVAIAKGQILVASHHIGDLEHLAAYRSFRQAVDHLQGLYGVTPDVVAHDMHPEYLSTKYALDLESDEGIPLWPVQHHHAHVASCLVEHGRTDRVLGIVFDGLGFGLDGRLWGGEWLIANLESCQRVGHLKPVTMPGGAAAIKEPWRMAMSWLAAIDGPAAAAREGSRLDDRWAAVLSVIENGDAPTTTSAGRLFDAVAALLGIRGRISYEGQAAIELEACAAGVPDDQAPHYPAGKIVTAADDQLAELDPAPLIDAIVADRDRGTSLPLLAAGFHRGFAESASRLAALLAQEAAVSTVALSGGVFQNVRLSRLIETQLTQAGLEVLVHERVPPNDGGVSVGQAAIAALA